MTTKSAPTDTAGVVKELRARGFSVRNCRGHWKVFEPETDKVVYSLGSSVSDHRSIRNTVAELRRLGIADLSVPYKDLQRIKKREARKRRATVPDPAPESAPLPETVPAPVPAPDSEPVTDSESEPSQVTAMDLLIDLAAAFGRDPDEFLLTLMERYVSGRRHEWGGEKVSAQESQEPSTD